MSLLDIRDNPDYVNANEATKRAIFEQYSRDDSDYVNANQATRDAIQKEFGLSVSTPSETPTTTAGDVVSAGVQAAAPALTSSQIKMVPRAAVPPPGVMGPGFALAPEFKPTGFDAQAVKQGLSPLSEAVPKTMGIYKQQPLAGVVDAAAVFGFGAPPPVASFQGGKGIMALPSAVGATTSEIGKMTSSGAPIAGSPRTTTMDPYYNLRDAVRRAGAPEIYDDIMAKGWQQGGGGNNAVLKNLENNSKFQKLLMNNPEVAQAFESYRGSVPSKMAQMGKVVGPVLRGAARVAGPVAMAADIYQAQQFAEESQLGQRLAQGEGAIAPKAFRSMNVPYGSGFTDTMSPDQASAVLESGSERDITAFGGRDRLRELIRLKAAERVLGPVAPRGM